MSKNLFQEFDPVSAKQWKQKIQVDLKGADYNDTLIWQSLEGIDVKPFYHSDDASSGLSSSRETVNWKITQSVFVDRIPVAQKLAVQALEKGAEALYLDYDKPFKLERVMEVIDLNTTTIYLANGPLNESIIAQRDKLRHFFDPIGHWATTGNWFNNRSSDLQSWFKLSADGRIGLDLSIYSNAGANRVQELAYSMSQLNEYFELLGAGAMTQKLTIDLRVSIGSLYFFEIAKLRALRKLVQTLAEEWGYTAEVRILATPGRRNKTLFDYNVNLLRTTTECMSAILGGADAVCNLAYDAIYHKDNAFGSRIARNQLLVLKNESYFDWVRNPADGSFYIESISEQLAQKALELFKEIEKAGGFIASLRSGTIQRKIKESAAKEQALFDDGSLALVGTNIFQNPDDRMQQELELYPFVKNEVRKTDIEPITARRLAENLEKQRLNEEA